ncbi:MAG: competence protein [Sulfurovum sp. AS07-7]|nr:MAG: competence protein [Sulfurovum sp. AS07-7]TQV63035.1 MAG: DUF507 family protein [Sulfurovum sp.]
MRLKPHQTGYVANIIGIDLVKAPFVTLLKGKEAVVAKCKEIIDENLAKERTLDLKVNEIIEQNIDEIEFQHIKERELFFMIKKKLAEGFGVIMDYNDRYNDLAHTILDELYENYLIEYSVNENQVKNVIFKAFKSFANTYEKIDTIVYEKIKKMEKKYTPNTQEYEFMYQKLYEEELAKRGML